MWITDSVVLINIAFILKRSLILNYDLLFSGPYIVALSKTWCPHHFVCANAHCKRSLEESGFVEEQGKLYCENCYEAYLAPICAKCSNRIRGVFISLINHFIIQYKKFRHRSKQVAD